MSNLDVNSYSKEELVSRIVSLTEGLAGFWKDAGSWAPEDAGELLTKSRLEWQASLARQLRLFILPENTAESGLLILAWAALGSQVEGMLKLFLAVRLDDYRADVLKYDMKAHVDKKGGLIDPDELMLEKLRVFFAQRVWPDCVRARWKAEGRPDWIAWILKIQQRRNAIHAFQDRDIGTFDEFHQDLRNYLAFMRQISNTFPYPDDTYQPREF